MAISTSRNRAAARESCSSHTSRTSDPDREAPRRHGLRRRLERLEQPKGNGWLRLRDAIGDHLCDWLSDDEFEELADLLRCGLAVDTAEPQRLLALAWQRRKQRQPPAGEMWRVRIAEGRPTLVPRDDGRGY